MTMWKIIRNFMGTSGFGLVLVLLFQYEGVAAQSRINYDDVLSISFATEKKGWVSGRWGTILHTDDGGKTWVRQESGTHYTLVSIHFPDADNGWAVGANGTIVHSNDGGNRWHPQTGPVPYYHMGVYFKNSREGWVISERTHILHTKDGGTSWQIQFQDGDFILKDIAFADELNGWVVGEFGHIYYTVDGGNSWQKQAGNYDIDYNTGELVGDPSLNGVTALDAKTAWAVGMGGHVIHTRDGGANWTQVDINIPLGTLFCIESDGNGNIVIGGKGGCAQSTDQGATWQPSVYLPEIKYSWISCLENRGKGNFAFMAGGEKGSIYKSQDSEEWRRVDLQEEEILQLKQCDIR